MKFLLSIVFFLMLFFKGLAQADKADDALLLEYYQNQRFGEAAEYLKKVYPEPVKDLKPLKQLPYTANMAGHFADAEIYYQRIFNLDSSSISALFSLGSINLRRGNILKAESYYKKIAARDTTNFMVYKQLAQISSDKNDISSQIVFLQKANFINPAEPDVAAELSDLYISLKLTAQAEKVLTTALTADPENVVLLNSLFKLVYAQKKWAETVNTGIKLIGYGNRSGFVMTRLGVAYYNMKNYECAIATFKEMDEAAKNETSYYYLALSYKMLKDQQMALNNLQKAIAEGVSPNISTYYGEIADSEERLFKYHNAALAYQKSLQFDIKPMIYYSLANLYDTGLKNKKNVIKYYRKYLAEKPSLKQKNYTDYAKSRLAILNR